MNRNNILKYIGIACVLISLMGIAYLAGLSTSNPTILGQLKWYHQLDCSNESDGLTCIHIANECIGVSIIKSDGVYCYG